MRVFLQTCYQNGQKQTKNEKQSVDPKKEERDSSNEREKRPNNNKNGTSKLLMREFLFVLIEAMGWWVRVT
jgi:hypothetical protein